MQKSRRLVPAPAVKQDLFLAAIPGAHQEGIEPYAAFGAVCGLFEQSNSRSDGGVLRFGFAER
jgi:hypothetical protein